jgi:AcrR family transcriptional regulator
MDAEPSTEEPGAKPEARKNLGRGDSNERLLQAAAELISERGYERTAVAEVARRAGLTTGAIYGQYSGKADLLAAALEMQMVDSVQDLLDSGDRHTTAYDVLASLSADLMGEQQQSPALLLEAFAAGQRDPALQQLLRSGFDHDNKRLSELIDQGKDAAIIDAELDTHAIITLCHAVALGVTLLRSISWDLPSPEAWGGLVDRLMSAAPPPSDLPATADPGEAVADDSPNSPKL